MLWTIREIFSSDVLISFGYGPDNRPFSTVLNSNKNVFVTAS